MRSHFPVFFSERERTGALPSETMETIQTHQLPPPLLESLRSGEALAIMEGDRLVALVIPAGANGKAPSPPPNGNGILDAEKLSDPPPGTSESFEQIWPPPWK